MESAKIHPQLQEDKGPRTGPLKSILMRSHGRKAFINVEAGGLRKVV